MLAPAAPPGGGGLYGDFLSAGASSATAVRAEGIQQRGPSQQQQQWAHDRAGSAGSAAVPSPSPLSVSDDASKQRRPVGYLAGASTRSQSRSARAVFVPHMTHLYPWMSAEGAQIELYVQGRVGQDRPRGGSRANVT